MWYVKKWDFTTMYFYGHDSAFLASSTPSNTVGGVPAGTRAPTWNGGVIGTHYTYNPPPIFFYSHELIPISPQTVVGGGGTAADPGEAGDIYAPALCIRYY